MFLAGIVLIACAFLILPTAIIKTSKQNKPFLPVILFQGISGVLVLLLSIIILSVVCFFYTAVILQKFESIYLLDLIFSWVIAATAGFLMALTAGQKLLAGYVSRNEAQLKYAEWHARLLSLHFPTILLCLIIGIWDIIYATSLYALIKSGLQVTP